jgi:Tfp pilus assembly protein FimV
VKILKIGPGAGTTSTGTQTTPTVNIGQQQQQQPNADQQPPQAMSAPGTERPQITNVPENVSGPVGTVARQHGEELVPVGPGSNSRQTRSTQTNPGNRTTGTEYKAQAGDSLSKMASRFMGSNTKANRDAIVAANPSLKDDPNKVIVGKTYIIPVASLTPAAPTDATPAPSEPAVAPQRVASTDSTSPARETAEYWYTVKEGDSLWRIATEQCGRAGAVAAIKELNLDTLKGEEHDVVIVGSKLRLPGKPVASAAAPN